MGIQAIELYRRMPSDLINEVTYICVLNACSHSGLVDEARIIFKNISIKTDRIYTPMVILNFHDISIRFLLMHLIRLIVLVVHRSSMKHKI